VKRVVVGLPLRLDGTRGEMAEEAARFAERVRKQFGVAVEMVDERLTSWEAERLLEERAGRRLHTDPRSRARQGRPPEKGKTSVDAIAATVILEQYLQQSSDESI
jgi:putative holliday junction resolvase